MSVGAIGSAIFTNQMTPVASSAANAHNNRVDFQNMVAQSTMQEKDEKVIEVRPTEENHEVDPDREHTRDEADRETSRDTHDSDETDEEQETPVHRLDITV